MSRARLMKPALRHKLLFGALLCAAALPATALAQEAEHPLNTPKPVYMLHYKDVTGPERPLNTTKLPFMRETSAQSVVVAPQGAVSAEGLASQVNGCRFQDIGAHRSVKAINYLYEKGIVGGRRPCYFDPNAVATRAEAAAMVVRAANLPLPESAEPKAFVDLDLKKSSAKSVKAAKMANLVHGYPDQMYRPEKPVNVTESLKIVTRGFKSDFAKVNPQLLNSNTDLSQWYAQYINAGFNEGLLEKNATRIDMMTQVTRAELAEMIFTMLQNRR